MKVVKNFPFQPQPHLLRVGAVLISIQDLFRGDGIGYSFVLSFGRSAISTPPSFLRFVNALPSWFGTSSFVEPSSNLEMKYGALV